MSRLTDVANEETSLAADDLLYTVDVSDTTDNPAGSSAKIQLQNLMRAGHFNTEAATDGQVLTSDGLGNAAWETPTGGGGGTTDIVTEIEIQQVSNRLSPSDLDTDKDPIHGQKGPSQETSQGSCRHWSIRLDPHSVCQGGRPDIDGRAK